MNGRFSISSEFLRYTAVLMSGTMIAQALGYVFAPVITRLFTPEEAAPLGMFLRIVAVGAAIATARYELSLPLPKNDTHSFRLYQVAMRNTIIVTCLSFLMMIIPAIWKSETYSFIFFLLVPVGIFLTAMFNLGNNWALRQRFFRSMSIVKVSNSIVSNVSKVLFGLGGIGYSGLIHGTIFGLVAGNILFIREYFAAKTKHRISFNSSRNYVLARQYIDFPKINLPHVMTDLLRDLVVALAILQLFSQADFGLYDHSYRMLRLPLILIGAAIGQVLFQRVSEMFNKGEDIFVTVRNSVVMLALLSVIPFSVIMMYGEEIFTFVFGENWSGSGVFAEIMAPWLMVNFVTSPVSSLPLVLRKQKEFFMLSVAGTVLMIATVTLPATLWDAGVNDTLAITAAGQIVYLAGFLVMMYHYIRRK